MWVRQTVSGLGAGAGFAAALGKAAAVPPAGKSTGSGGGATIWMWSAERVRSQTQRQRGPKVYALHAPEVECIGKGKARTPYELMAWTTPASGSTLQTRAGQAEAKSCHRPLPPSGSTW